MTEKLIRTTAKLYDARDAMRRLHGDNWPQKINEISPIIRGVAKKGNTSILSAAIQIAEKASKDGQPMASVMVLAVACELSENDLAMPPPGANRGNLSTLKNMIEAKSPPHTTGQPQGVGIRALFASLSDGRTRCKNCDSDQLEWLACTRNAGGVQDGRIQMHEVVPEFVLGCAECSETLRVVRGDDVAALLNAMQSEANADVEARPQ